MLHTVAKETHPASPAGSDQGGQITWPVWPEVARNAERYVLDAIHSGRWAISSLYNGAPLYEQRFAKEFSEYLGADFCIPTDHGSSALVIALEALGADYGSEVVIPAMTWTATATAVFRAGLVPVIADVDPETGCLTPETIREAVSGRTAAIIVVHWACVMADMPAIMRFAEHHSLAVIEDAAQAHGAAWEGRRAGTFGHFGCFSMQHAKVLTCGEGGAVVTSDGTAARRLEELRADSRSYRTTPVMGQLELHESASIMGANFGIDEISAALLVAQLEMLPAQQAKRTANYHLLDDLLGDCDDVTLLSRDPRQDTLSLYEVPILFPRQRGVTEQLASSLSSTLGVRVYQPRVPLHRSALLQPQTKPTLGPLAEHYIQRLGQRTFPGAEHLANSAVLLHHSAFLASAEHIHFIAEAVKNAAAHDLSEADVLEGKKA